MVLSSSLARAGQALTETRSLINGLKEFFLGTDDSGDSGGRSPAGPHATTLRTISAQ